MYNRVRTARRRFLEQLSDEALAQYLCEAVRYGIIHVDELAPLAIVRIEAGLLACKNLGTLKARGIIYEGRMLELRAAEARTAINALHFFPRELGYAISLVVLDFVEEALKEIDEETLLRLKAARAEATDSWENKHSRRRYYYAGRGHNPRERNLLHLYNDILQRVSLLRSPVLQLRALGAMMTDREMYQLMQPPTIKFVLERIESVL